jgi:wyosine [tRNA(Phe)-imidazoG37] synthetase (radical SAM superfamily)
MREPSEEEMSPVPYGTTYFFLPGRSPWGIHRKKSKKELIAQPEDTVAVGLVPPPGYTRTLLPAYKNNSREPLPFFAYSLGAYRGGECYIAAIQTESSYRWEPSQYDSVDLDKRIKKRLKKTPGNRLLAHLSHCALNYHCYNAQNIFMGRWEGGIPVAPACNADCLGCISRKRKKPPLSPQKRITFVPEATDIVEIAVEHLQTGEAIVSFGQGCEGEPLLQAKLIEEAIMKIRQKTDRGTIHINTNASMPGPLEKLMAAGLDSIRISMNSAIEERYNLYYSPSGYQFSSVKKSLRAAVSKGIFVSINLLVMPGITDSEEELEHLEKLLHEYRPHMIQLRNLNIDPDIYFGTMPAAGGKKIGIPAMIRRLKRAFPALMLGNFTPPLKA